MDINQLTTFITNHPWLFGIVVLALVLLIFLELRNKSAIMLSSQELIEHINRDRAVLWDLRSGKDFKQGHITSAKNVQPDKLTNEITKTHKTKQPIVLICNNGMQSAQQVKKLIKVHADMFYLQGGITEWRNQNLPLIKA